MARSGRQDCTMLRCGKELFQGKRPAGVAECVFENALEDGGAQSQPKLPAICGMTVSILEPGNDIEAVFVMVETSDGGSYFAKNIVKSDFAGVAERSVADIVRQGTR